MERRSFLKTLLGGVAASAAVRTWPFRVYSFPSEIKTPDMAFIYDFDLELVGLHGIRYHQSNDGVGPWLGLNRSPYPIGFSDKLIAAQKRQNALTNQLLDTLDLRAGL